eukprot:CAMPEP_0172504622 /NCGR_PEP_ID=MMETSP1066-20121228/180404_1 /TAXON_ID=671091 /ORGANISM="Coscinodiscus wailesii, Strain CCMP2513" /LENGTH=210 /DNA_ID=CAMNT_0013280895 /DNA_START=575 /DNA_END=1207 /DNA_ORIENTATION=-
MPGEARLNVEFGLHFFEPRYRLLIAEIMRPYPEDTKRGHPLSSSNDNGSRDEGPVFIYANHAPLAPESPACLVRVKQCFIHPNGRADVFLVPVAYVWLESVWERENTGGLCYATILRMGEKETQMLEEEVEMMRERRRRFFDERRLEVNDGDQVAPGDGAGIRGSIHSIIQYLISRHEDAMDASNHDEGQEDQNSINEVQEMFIDDNDDD